VSPLLPTILKSSTHSLSTIKPFSYTYLYTLAEAGRQADTLTKNTHR